VLEKEQAAGKQTLGANQKNYHTRGSAVEGENLPSSKVRVPHYRGRKKTTVLNDIVTAVETETTKKRLGTKILQ